jgi:hypothetical protein
MPSLRNRVTRPQREGVETDGDLQLTLEEVAVLIALVAQHPAIRGRAASGRVDDFDEVEVRTGVARQLLPDDGAVHDDPGTVAWMGHRDLRPLRPGRPGVARRAEVAATRLMLTGGFDLGSRGAPGRVCGGAPGSVGSELCFEVGVVAEQLVDGDIEQLGQGVQRRDRGLGLAGLDLGDERRGHAQLARGLTDREPGALAHGSQPRSQVHDRRRIALLGCTRCRLPVAARIGRHLDQHHSAVGHDDLTGQVVGVVGGEEHRRTDELFGCCWVTAQDLRRKGRHGLAGLR